MRMWFLAAGAAALAIAAPVSAERGGQGKKGQQAEKSERGGGKSARSGQRGGGKSVRANQRGGGKSSARAERRGGNRTLRAERRGGDRVRAERRGEARLAVMRQERGKSGKAENRGRGRNEVRVSDNRRDRERVKVRGNDRREDRVVLRGRGDNRNDVRIRGRGDDDRRVMVRRDRDRDGDFVRVREARRDGDFVRLRDRRGDFVRVRDFDGDVIRVRDVDRFRWGRAFANGFIDGCPPGLAKKNNGCMPPGLVRSNVIGTRFPVAFRSNVLPIGLRDFWRDDDDFFYRYGNGYVYRVDRDTQLIASLLPLFGGGFGLGQVFPNFSSPNYFMPSYYQPFYASSPFVDYRYSNGYVYAVDPYNGMIEDIIPLYDRGYGIGQMLPASYGYYNLPYPYRDYYPVSSNYSYRYAPGAIYQVDPTTSLITALVSLLAPGLSIGQPLPMGYDVYNVPFAYRDRYFDTPDSWYRYSNGYIYQVDPRTRLVSSRVVIV